MALILGLIIGTLLVNSDLSSLTSLLILIILAILLGILKYLVDRK